MSFLNINNHLLKTWAQVLDQLSGPGAFLDWFCWSLVGRGFNCLSLPVASRSSSVLFPWSECLLSPAAGNCWIPAEPDRLPLRCGSSKLKEWWYFRLGDSLCDRMCVCVCVCVTLSCGLHAWRRVDRVSKQTVPWHLEADYPSTHWTYNHTHLLLQRHTKTQVTTHPLTAVNADAQTKLMVSSMLDSEVLDSL